LFMLLGMGGETTQEADCAKAKTGRKTLRT
jgi:hypothetical protein